MMGDEGKENLKEVEESIGTLGNKIDEFSDSIDTIMGSLPDHISIWDYPKSKKKKKEAWEEARKLLKEKYPKLNKEFDDLEELVKSIYFRLDEVYDELDKSSDKANEIEELASDIRDTINEYNI